MQNDMADKPKGKDLVINEQNLPCLVAYLKKL